jgi:hypothetical protein
MKEWIQRSSQRVSTWNARSLSLGGRLAIASAIYVVVTAVCFAVAPRTLWFEHTAYNHFSHLAHAWLNGRLDLVDGPPAYAGNNDFVLYKDKWFVAFPPFPALLLLPAAAVAKDPDLVRDGQIFLWLSGLAPALLFLALERLRLLTDPSAPEASPRARGTLGNAALALLFAFGSVYFFTAVQGTVWFAAHVVGAALAAGYLYCSLGAANPFAAGLCLGLGFLTRTPLLFAFPLFLQQALQVSLAAVPATTSSNAAGFFARLWVQLRAPGVLASLLKKLLLFGTPLALCVAISLYHNAARFGSPWESGYQYLQVAWRARMVKWGLFHVHYLPRNLGVLLSQLPWVEEGLRSFRINVHGLALWFTTPLYVWLLWPRRTSASLWALWLTVALVAVPTLFYQNTGWSQFGYRFSNDYAVFLFALLAMGGRRFGVAWWGAAMFALLVNSFGAVTFGRSQYSRFYFSDSSQERFYQPD